MNVSMAQVLLFRKQTRIEGNAFVSGLAKMNPVVKTFL
jgi:hypothetical protein